MIRKILVLIFVVLALAALVFAAVWVRKEYYSENFHKLIVVTTLFPLYDMAKNIGGELAAVNLLMPPGMEAHSFEPTPENIIQIKQADIFVYTGKFMEPWASDIINGVANKNLAVVDSSDGVTIVASDPHVWLDFGNAKTMVNNILAAYEQKDPVHSDYFETRAATYIKNLANLDSEFRTGLASCKTRELIYGGHYAFGYLARRYGLNYFAAEGISPDAEPTVVDLAILADQIRRRDIKYVFYEELTSPKIAETIASETSAQLLLLSAAHNITKDQFKRGVSFFDILKSDLDNLRVGLGCK